MWISRYHDILLAMIIVKDFALQKRRLHNKVRILKNNLKESPMNNGQQIKTKESLQVKLHQFLNKFRHAFSLPEYKNIFDICLGIAKSQSVIGNRIAQSLGENISLKKTCERLYRNLRREDLGERLQDCIIDEQVKGLNSDTAIIVDDSDLIKSKANKMEGIKKVRDGSTKETGNGYDLVNFIACQPQEEGYQIKPLSSDLVSRKIEADSLIQITQDRIVDTIIASGNRGVYVFDRGYDSRHMLAFMEEHGCAYIIRAVGKRGLIVNGVEQNFVKVARSVKRHTTILSKSGKDSFQCGIKRVKIRLDGHPVKDPCTTEAWLVVARYIPKNKKARNGLFYFLCDFPNQDLSLDEIMHKVIHMYRLRWKIEEVHRHVKQEYGWEKMQLMSYTGLKNMNQLLLLTMCYVYSLKSIAHQLLLTFAHFMSYDNRSWKQIYEFAYYKITRVLSHCFAHVTRYNILEYGGKWAEAQQLIIPCLKNGGM